MSDTDYKITESLTTLRSLIGNSCRWCRARLVCTSILLNLLLLFPSSVSLHAATDSSFVLFWDISYAAKELSGVGTRLVSLPCQSTNSTLLTIGAAVVVETACMELGIDEKMRSTFKDLDHTTEQDNIVHIPNFYGTGAAALICSGGIYAGGLISGNDELRTSGRLVFESLVVGGLSVTIMKAIVGRARPYNNLGTTEFRPFSFKDSFYSFPSGHTAVAFCISSTLARRIDSFIPSVLLYTAATATGLARIYFDQHWLSDTILGAAIGIGSASIVCAVHDDSGGAGSSHSQLQILPSLSGLNICYSW